MNADQDLRVPLIRPQYVPATELLVSSLVQRHFTNPEKPLDVKGYRFLGTSNSAKVVTTGPVSLDDRQHFGESLKTSGVNTDAPDLDLADSVVGAVKGVAAAASKMIPASPLTLHLALSQNLSGVLSVNAPNIGDALESMYLMGEPKPSEPPEPIEKGQSMGARWLSATAQRAGEDPLLDVLDQTFAALGPFRGVEQVVPSEANGAVWRSRLSESTPFSWLHRSWNRLMTPEWVSALPARVWTDWSTMVLRTGLAFGYLWEMRWYENLGRFLLGSSSTSIPELPTGLGEVLLPWPPARLPIASRNVKRDIRQLVARGIGILDLLRPRLKEMGSVDAPTALSRLGAQQAVREEARRAMGGRDWNRPSKNTYETIIYALQQRNSAVRSTDYYGLLRPHGRTYSVVDPGTEWIAVVASLTCSGPGKETHLGEVMNSLEQIGLRPELQEIVRALEAAGLAQGSADADHGVRVRSAF